MDNYFVLIAGPFANLSCDLKPRVGFITWERSLHTIEFRYIM